MTTRPKPRAKLRNRAHPKDLADALRPYTEEEKQAAIALLRSWRDVSEEEAREQEETLRILMKALNEDRLSDRDRFPST